MPLCVPVKSFWILSLKIIVEAGDLPSMRLRGVVSVSFQTMMLF